MPEVIRNVPHESLLKIHLLHPAQLLKSRSAVAEQPYSIRYHHVGTGLYDPVCMTGHYAARNTCVFEAYAVSVVAVLFAALCNIKLCVIVKFEESVKTVCVVIMSM